MKIGIEAASFYVPHLYLEIKELAEKRGIDSLKLEKGLGLHKMALPDVHEDAVTFAAEAFLKLINDFNLDPRTLSRVYLGTESSVDAAKPTSTFVLSLIEEQMKTKFGERCFKHCDTIDMTFACVGAVDALQNAIDFITVHPDKKAVVIASDYAKYELNSTGEYTQGGGAVAILISNQPDLLEIEDCWGIGMESVFDFFKPRRNFKKSDLINAPEHYPDKIQIFTDEPVFDGQYSNDCFQNRIREAYEDFKQQKGISKIAFDQWRYLIFHLPYAFHGKRIFGEIYGIEKGLPYSTKEEIKAITKSEEYRAFVKQKIEPSQRASSEIGNMYAASIFMALLSTLQVAFDEDQNLAGKKLGFLGYGSGSKSKVFEGTIGENWKNVAATWHLFDQLNQRKAVDFETYEKLHRKQLEQSLSKKGFYLDHIEEENPVLKGARYYKHQA